MVQDNYPSGVFAAKVRVEVGCGGMAAERRSFARCVPSGLADVQARMLEQQDLCLDDMVWMYPVRCFVTLGAQRHRVHHQVKVEIPALLDASRYVCRGRLAVGVLGMRRRRAIGIKSGAERVEHIDVLVQEIAQIQLEQAIRPATDLLLKDMTEFPVLCPALVLLEDLDEARPLGDLESRERPDLLAGPAVVSAGVLSTRVPAHPAYLATSASIFAYLSTIRAGRRPLAGLRRARS